MGEYTMKIQEKNGLMDLTQGEPLPRILLFALPLILGSLFQQLYNFVDTVFVGRFLGADALAAVGADYSLNFLVIAFVQGMCVGFGVLLSQHFGAKCIEEVNAYFWNGALLCTGMAALLAVGAGLLARPVLTVLNTPPQILEMSAAYIQVIFAGIPATMLYNYTAGTLRAVGDSRHPFYFLVGTTFLNVALDYLLIVPLRCGVAGAAWATVLSQLVSGLLNSWWLLRRAGIIRRPQRNQLSPERMRRLCAIGVPMGFQQSISGIGLVLLQSAINTLGSALVAAQATGEKIRVLFTQPMVDLGGAISTYTGQNYGARSPGRIRRGIRCGLLIQGAYSAAVWLFLFFCKRPLVGLVLGETASEAAQGAIRYLAVVSTLFILLGGLVVFRSVLQGLGHGMLAVFSGVVELAARFVLGPLLVPVFGFGAVCAANPCSWGTAMVYSIVMYRCVGIRLPEKE